MLQASSHYLSSVYWRIHVSLVLDELKSREHFVNYPRKHVLFWTKENLSHCNDGSKYTHSYLQFYGKFKFTGKNPSVSGLCMLSPYQLTPGRDSGRDCNDIHVSKYDSATLFAGIDNDIEISWVRDRPTIISIDLITSFVFFIHHDCENDTQQL